MATLLLTCLAQAPAAPPGAPHHYLLCDDNCVWSSRRSDGTCDDGGPGSEWSSCALGSDCTDCGPRWMLYPAPPGGYSPPPSPSPAPPGVTVICENTCAPNPRYGQSMNYQINNGYCSDGGPGASFFCNFGTDCDDCGPRFVAPPPPPPTVAGPPSVSPTVSGPPSVSPTVAGPPSVSPTVAGPRQSHRRWQDHRQSHRRWQDHRQSHRRWRDHRQSRRHRQLSGPTKRVSAW